MRAPARAAAEAAAEADEEADEEAAAKAEQAAEAGGEAGGAGEAGAALGTDGEPAGASPFRLADAAGWRVCAPWDAGLMLTREQLDALLLPAKRKGVYSAEDYE
jgi:hypothetical protein